MTGRRRIVSWAEIVGLLLLVFAAWKLPEPWSYLPVAVLLVYVVVGVFRRRDVTGNLAHLLRRHRERKESS